ncbi:MAG TPA: glycosyltransferase family 4 protein [Thermomicrobiaceae bacterium]|nr:glycosyltransferase family 4 protein [Thermomicrobiaceae bacterium]
MCFCRSPGSATIDSLPRLTFISAINIRWTHLEWMCRELDRERFDVSFLLVSIAGTRPYLEEFLTREGIPFTTLDCKLRPLSIARTVWRIRRYCRRQRVDIVHTHIFFASLVGLLGAWLAGVPVRVNTRHHAVMNHGTSFFWLDRLCNLLSTRVIATSEMLRQVLVGPEHVAPGKVSLVHLGIDLETFERPPAAEVAALAARYNPRRAAPVIGVIARHIELKGIQFVIPAFRRLLTGFPDAYLVLAHASGPYTPGLQQQLAEISADRYVLIRFEPDVAALYKIFDLCVHVPIGPQEESFGLVYVEALAAGVPSIFTLSGVAPELLVHRRNAWLVGYRDSDQIYDGMKALLGDDALRASLVEEGRRTVATAFSARRMVREIEAIYSRDLAKAAESTGA